MTGHRRRPDAREDGFTLVEMMVVVIVIGILAAIATPVYLGQQRSARDASVTSDVRNTSTLVSNWVFEHPKTALTNTGDYTAAGGQLAKSDGAVIDVVVAASGAYTVCGYNSGGGTYSSNSSAYLIDSAARTSGRTTAGCPGDGVAATPTSSPTPDPAGTTSPGGAPAGGSGSGSSPSSTPTPSPSASADWITCASENGTCSFYGTHVVRYGVAPNTWVTKTLSNGTPCNNSVFGDPAYGYGKTCQYLY